MTDSSLLIFKHGDGWVKREGGSRRGLEGMASRQTDREGKRMIKWQRRTRAALGRGFRVIKTDGETDKQTDKGGELGTKRWRGEERWRQGSVG